LTLRIGARPDAETGGFVHVDPESVNIYAGLSIEEAIEFAIPVTLRAGCKPIWESRDAGPDDAFVDASVGGGEESLVCDAVVERWIVLRIN